MRISLISHDVLLGKNGGNATLYILKILNYKLDTHRLHSMQLRVLQLYFCRGFGL